MREIKGLPPILFEDESLIAFDKPSGLLIAPDRWDKAKDNLIDAIHQKLSSDCSTAHRLDRETSGIVLCAKSKEVLQPLCRLFESLDIVKEYTALVRGGPAEDRGTVTLALEEDPMHHGQMVVGKKGKRAETEFVVTRRWRGFARVTLQPLTTIRTHQLRVHMASLGTPILADSAYGENRTLFLSHIKPDYKFKKNEKERPLMRRLALHASSLRFVHPVTGNAVEIVSPLPHEFVVSLKYLDRFASSSGPAMQDAGNSEANPTDW